MRTDIKLGNRMEMIAEMISDCRVLADVGCDHAYITIKAVKDGKAETAYAMDINEGPLARAAANIDAAGLSDRIHTVLSDGLDKIPESADEIIISGMGGMLITRILEEGKEKLAKCRRLIVSPQSDRAAVRKKIHELGFLITDDRDCFDEGKYYQCICAEHGREKYEWDMFYEYGVFLLESRSENLIRYLMNKKKKITEAEQSYRMAKEDETALPAELLSQKNSIEAALKFMGQ